MSIASALGLDNDDWNRLAVLVRPDCAMRQSNIRKFCANLVGRTEIESGSTNANIVLGRKSANEAWNLSPAVSVNSSPRLCKLWACHAGGGAYHGFVLGVRLTMPDVPDQAEANGKHR